MEEITELFDMLTPDFCIKLLMFFGATIGMFITMLVFGATDLFYELKLYLRKRREKNEK